MANLNDLAADLFGTRRLESGVRTGGTNNSSGVSGGSRTSNGGSSLSSTVGLATSDSQDGKVTVRISDYTTTSDIVFDDSVLGPEIEIGTTVNVKAGQYVHITLINHDKGSQPIVMGVIGGGDRVVKEIEERAEALNERMDDVEEDVTDLEERVGTAESKVTAVETSVTNLSERVVTAESKITTVEGNIVRLDTRVQDAEDAVDDIEDVLNGPDGHPEEGLKYKVNVEIPQYVDDARESAYKASEYATTALAGLGSVQNVADTLMWITQHGKMTLTADTEPDPTKLYFVVDPDGQYTVGGVHYSTVTEVDPDHMADYYEMSMLESVQNYLLTHLAVTEDGLHVFGKNGRIIVGESAGFHVTISPEKLAFCQGKKSDGHGGLVDNEIAWITNNELHVPKAVITEGLQVGHWRWTELSNSNFALKYIV